MNKNMDNTSISTAVVFLELQGNNNKMLPKGIVQPSLWAKGPRRHFQSYSVDLTKKRLFFLSSMTLDISALSVGVVLRKVLVSSEKGKSTGKGGEKGKHIRSF